MLFNRASNHWFLLLLVSCLLFSELPACAQKNRKSDKKEHAEERTSMEARTQFFEAIRQKNLGQLDQAKVSFKKSFELDPENDAALYEIGRILIQEGSFVEALTTVKSAISISPNNVYYKAMAADIHLQLGQNKDALKIYLSVLDQDPSSVDTYLAIAAIYEAQKNYTEANKYYALAESKVGAIPELIQQKVNNYISANKYADAIKELEKLLVSYPDEIGFKETLADLYLLNKNETAAIAVLNDIRKNFPPGSGAGIKLARIAVNQQQIEQSFEFSADAFTDPDQSIDNKMELMFIYFNIAKVKPEIYQNIEHLASIIASTHPNDPKSSAVYGDALNANKKSAQARQEYLKAVRLAPNKHQIWTEILNIDLELNTMDSLILDSKKCIDLFPNMPAFYYYNGIAYYEKKNYQKAIDAYLSGLSVLVDDPENEALFLNSLADAHHYNGEYKLADEKFDLVLKKNPNNLHALNNYSYFLSLRSDKLDLAKSMAEKVNQLAPNQPSYEDTYAWVLFKAGDYKQAKIWIEKAINNGGASSEIYEHYGDILFKLGETDKAQQNWLKAQALGSDSRLLPNKIATKKYLE